MIYENDTVFQASLSTLSALSFDSSLSFGIFDSFHPYIIFRYFTATSLYRKFRNNDIILLLHWYIIISGFLCTIDDLPRVNVFTRISAAFGSKKLIRAALE